MKFTGQIRVPEIDHPGVPATLLIEDVQVEVILEGGESLGRWSLYDVHARRLVSSAFQVELAGEEITFIADDPIDFAYRGVEHMAEVWARFKSMNVARRLVAVRRSRKRTIPSKISEIREAMVENLQAERGGFLSQKGPVRKDEITAESVAKEVGSLSVDPKSVESVEPAAETQMPVTDETTGDEEARLEAQRADAELVEQQRLEHELLEDEKRALAEERASLEAEKQSLEIERLKVEQTEADRVEAFRLEMERLESQRLEIARAEAEQLEQQRADIERLEAEHAESARQELASIENKREEIERLDTERAEQERADTEREEAIQAEMERLEAKRADIERLETEHAESARQELASIEKKREEIERLDTERAEQEGADTEREEAIQAEMERLEAKRAEQERLEAKKAAAEQAAAARAEQVSKQLVVDLGEFEEPATEPDPEPDPEPDLDGDLSPEPALAGAPREKSGIMGAVKSAFGRKGRNHVHQLVEVPGGIGIGRSICEECGYVSISSSD
ncbi:MAG: hypothetical protein IH818_07320 [Acidobacteria bacterium]|nr:hypothetical protein [Acidobacteriota bacterium]